MEISKIIVALHIFSGTLALIAGNLIAVLQKGNKLHRNIGRVYVLAMLLVFVTAFIRSVQTGNEFLLAIGFFSFCLTFSGWITIQRGKNPGGFAVLVSAILSMISGVFLILLGIIEPEQLWVRINPVPLVFGGICLYLGIEDFRFRNQVLTYKQRLQFHIGRLGGSLISAYTAFFVVNINFLPYWLVWLAPTVIGTLVIMFWIRKHVTGS